MSYCLANRKAKPDRYPMPILEELFNTTGFSQIINTLDLRFGYSQNPLPVEDQVKTTFWEINQDGNDQMYH